MHSRSESNNTVVAASQQGQNNMHVNRSKSHPVNTKELSGSNVILAYVLQHQVLPDAAADSRSVKDMQAVTC